MAYEKFSITTLVPDAREVLEQTTGILQAGYDASRFYVKGKNTCSFPYFSGIAIEEATLTGALTKQDPQTLVEVMDVDKKHGAYSGINELLDFQNILDSEEEALRAIVRNIGVFASNKVIAGMIANAASANNVTKASSGNKISENLIDMKAKVMAQGTTARMWGLLKGADQIALEKELVNRIRNNSDLTGVIDVVSGINILSAYDVPSSVLTKSLVFGQDAFAFCWGDYVYKSAESPATSDDEFSLVRAFGHKVLNSGKKISVLNEAA